MALISYWQLSHLTMCNTFRVLYHFQNRFPLIRLHGSFPPPKILEQSFKMPTCPHRWTQLLPRKIWPKCQSGSNPSL